MEFIIAQVIGFVGTLVFAVGFQCKSTWGMLACHSLSSVIYAIHFFLLKGYTGCLMQILFVINGTILCLKGHGAWAEWKGWKWVISAAAAILTFATWQGPVSLLSGGAFISSTLSNWSYNGKVIRVARLGLVSPLWLTYDICVKSFSGIICEIFTITSAVISIWRYGLNNLE